MSLELKPHNIGRMAADQSFNCKENVNSFYAMGAQEYWVKDFEIRTTHFRNGSIKVFCPICIKYGYANVGLVQIEYTFKELMFARRPFKQSWNMYDVIVAKYECTGPVAKNGISQIVIKMYLCDNKDDDGKMATLIHTFKVAGQRNIEGAHEDWCDKEHWCNSAYTPFAFAEVKGSSLTTIRDVTKDRDVSNELFYDKEMFTNDSLKVTVSVGIVVMPAFVTTLADLTSNATSAQPLSDKLDDAGDLSDEKAQWKKAADEMRRLCVSRFHSAAQSYGGTALLELHLSQVQLTQVHLPARKVSSQVASAAANVTFGVAKAVLVGSYGTLVKGLGQAVSASIDAVSQQLSQTCFEQLKELSEPPVDDNELENWLQKMHDEHFKCGDEGHWEPKGEGRWEPKAAFSVVLADLVAARPPRLTPQLFEMVCLGGKGFIGLANLMALGSHSAADVDARHAGLVNLTMWAQEVVLQTLESEISLDDPAADTAQPTELPTNDGGWGDGHGLQVLAEELERAIQEGTAMLASSAKRLTAAVAEGVSEQVRDVLVCGAREDVVRGKPQAVAALAACNSVLDGVEGSLRGVGAAARGGAVPLPAVAPGIAERSLLGAPQSAELGRKAQHGGKAHSEMGARCWMLRHKTAT
eukprot:gene3718-4658_t